MLHEAEITCPYCWESLQILLDMSVPEQDYIEDCQVCCQPIRIIYACEGDTVTRLDALTSDG